MIYNNNLKDIMKLIEHVKIDNDISNNDIANKMRKSKQTVSNLLNCKQTNITLDTLEKLCNAVNCDLIIDIKKRD